VAGFLNPRQTLSRHILSQNQLYACISFLNNLTGQSLQLDKLQYEYSYVSFTNPNSNEAFLGGIKITPENLSAPLRGCQSVDSDNAIKIPSNVACALMKEGVFSGVNGLNTGAFEPSAGGSSTNHLILMPIENIGGDDERINDPSFSGDIAY
jgi:hypothetical protein